MSGRPSKKLRWALYVAAALLLWAGAEFIFDFFPEEKKEFRQRGRTTVENTFPEHAAKVAATFGLNVYQGRSGQTLSTDRATPSVVLIHGVDDPGKVWMNLAPVLIDGGLYVLEMRYPNDQPIRDSARLFYRELMGLSQLGIERVSIVAHSMGGLVAREMLTNPKFAYQLNAVNGEVPRVAGLIMLGTPNHGSELARFRVLAEVRDQWSHLLRGQGHLLRAILDGAGEAKIDLLPNSRFLQTLNARPHPSHVQLLIIAGVASPWDGDDVTRLINAARQHVPAAERRRLEDLESFLNSMTDGLGDGLVTVESTRLDGIDHRIVRGTHLSMIRNLTANDPRVPPAVPIVVDALTRISTER